MNSNIEHFSDVIVAGESGFMMTATEVDRHDAGHKWTESTLSHSDLWCLDPDDEETPDDEGEDEEFIEEEIESTEPTA